MWITVAAPFCVVLHIPDVPSASTSLTAKSRQAKCGSHVTTACRPLFLEFISHKEIHVMGQSGTPTKKVTATSDANVNGILEGSAWNHVVNGQTVLTWSEPTSSTP